jgi:hypothetical protein
MSEQQRLELLKEAYEFKLEFLKRCIALYEQLKTQLQ